jgi:uncharacterized protein (DUF488 family)
MIRSAPSVKLYTIGFTQSSAEQFFERLAAAGVREIFDTRAHRDGQLSGFAKADDLRFFLRKLVGVRYRVAAELAPPNDMLRAFKARRMTWSEYARAYSELLESQRPIFDESVLDHACLLCSERTHERCHRALAASYLVAHAGGPIEIVHL